MFSGTSYLYGAELNSEPIGHNKQHEFDSPVFIAKGLALARAVRAYPESSLRETSPRPWDKMGKDESPLSHNLQLLMPEICQTLCHMALVR